ncbi:hypothetical protein HPB47_016230 [Ixodes persulcatus]|uniref:Uncharacterized protein n=1 Tax=Ixodes persulcatus TaxID=34615 RepID=A0AC60R0A7_IXOPE|nr:hypothetical protein HPB47_016230 [Ixodes persulcatus]
MKTAGLTLRNEPGAKTRIGMHSGQKNSTPDLSWATASLVLDRSTWRDNLDSDHFPVEMKIHHGQRISGKEQRPVVKWDRFRKLLETEDNRDIEECIRMALSEAKTKVVVKPGAPTPDNHLLNLWASRQQALQGYRKNKTLHLKIKRPEVALPVTAGARRPVGLRLERLTSGVMVYAYQVAGDECHDIICVTLGGTNIKAKLGQANITDCDRLRRSADSEGEGEDQDTKTYEAWAKKQREFVKKFTQTIATTTEVPFVDSRSSHIYEGDGEKLIRELTSKYLKTQKSGNPTFEYEGDSNVKMDEAFTELELVSAIDESNQGSAPGIDGVTYKVLKNMSDKSRAELLNLANASWEKGSLPKEWNEAEVRFIPKPEKPPHVDNLRPTSLTSCVGKMPPTMYGFRRHLSTQDVLDQLHELVIKKAKTPSPRAILALDTKGAFDNVTHEKEKSKPIAMGDRGTPQGSVLSPLLFNLALLPLPALLQDIEGIDLALYADDITVWTSRAGLESWMEEQWRHEASKTVHEFAKLCGLSCSPQKSELLVIKPRRKKGEQENVRITIDGTNITQTTQARILGVIFQNNGKAGALIDKIKVSTGQISNMIRRVTNRRRGLKEEDALTLVQAFVMSRIVYAAPYLKLLKKDRDQLNVTIRKATKIALGVPKHSSTDKLLGMAKHNVVEELIEAHLSNQRVRLSQTSAGRRVLDKLGWQEADRKETGPLPRVWAPTIDSKPLRRNMRPGRNDGRRAVRIAPLTEALGQIEEEEEGPLRAVTTRDVLVTCASIKTCFPKVAEEAAIALALAQPKEYAISSSRSPLPPLTIPTTPTHPSSSLTERWETLLNNPVLEDQLVLISRGQAAMEAHGSREEGTTSIDGV